MNAEIIAIGSELLTPHRMDTNSLYLTDQLNRLGIEVRYKTVVGDDRECLTATLSLSLSRSNLVLAIGGLGPTADDLTRECAAAALGRTLRRDDSLVERIAARFRSRGLRMPEINLRQAMVIEGADVLPNPNGTAPGLWIEQGQKLLILLPGPPRELQPLFETTCLPRLRAMVPPRAIRTRVLRMTGITESGAEELAAPIYTRFTNPLTTILAALGEIQLHLRGYGADDAEAEARLEELAQPLEKALGKYIFSNRGQSLEEVVGDCLTERSATLAVAESCTGGLLAQRITSVSGSSVYFLGGIVCYSNSLKRDWLEVSPEDLETKGAVSPEVAQALAEGIRLKTGSTYGLGITGIAGPTGGTPQKPVGLVYVALAGPESTQVLERKYLGERETVRWQATQTALDMARRALLGL
ncbi:MAG: competence/damage-inducible protein A [Acidobacteria bacterium]|nr:competence/damage-inducible protein A [Acidobacteriota bacterium]